MYYAELASSWCPVSVSSHYQQKLVARISEKAYQMSDPLTNGISQTELDFEKKCIFGTGNFIDVFK